jgi:TRAP-type mannitol/chloroaromatic compound transport system permease small subunit
MANKHVRVDIIYARASPRKQAWLDLFSTLVFLFPWVILLTYFAWPYVTHSWALYETSSQVGGMPGLYVMKTIILAFSGLMFLQGLAICGRCILVLNGQGHLAPPRAVSGLGE